MGVIGQCQKPQGTGYLREGIIIRDPQSEIKEGLREGGKRVIESVPKG